MTTTDRDLPEQIDKAFDLLHHVDGGLNDAAVELLRIVKAAQAEAWEEGRVAAHDAWKSGGWDGKNPFAEDEEPTR